MIRALLLALVIAATPAASGQEKAPPLALDGITVTPEQPGADALCQLRVRVRNRSEKTVTGLAFTVSVAGRELPVYQRQVYLQAFPPGATTELRLYNFWTGETGRPSPPDGKLPLTVTLREAQYVTITKAANGDETWELGDPVAGLPARAETVVNLKR